MTNNDPVFRLLRSINITNSLAIEISDTYNALNKVDKKWSMGDIYILMLSHICKLYGYRSASEDLIEKAGTYDSKILLQEESIFDEKKRMEIDKDLLLNFIELDDNSGRSRLAGFMNSSYLSKSNLTIRNRLSGENMLKNNKPPTRKFLLETKVKGRRLNKLSMLTVDIPVDIANKIATLACRLLLLQENRHFYKSFSKSTISIEAANIFGKSSLKSKEVESFCNSMMNTSKMDRDQLEASRRIMSGYNTGISGSIMTTKLGRRFTYNYINIYLLTATRAIAGHLVSNVDIKRLEVVNEVLGQEVLIDFEDSIYFKKFLYRLDFKGAIIATTLKSSVIGEPITIDDFGMARMAMKKDMGIVSDIDSLGEEIDALL